jgi:pyruvate,orthophosphate dikinase
MTGYPVTFRLLDPPLHEFLPHTKEELAGLATAMKLPLPRLKALVAGLTEANPMLGHRGCRLGITYPEITEMQARAIFEAALNTGKETGRPVQVEIMVPLVAYRREFEIVREIIVNAAREVEMETGSKFDYSIGTMIELPRAALKAGELAAGQDGAQFFSFGTNDLTQTTLGLSRDDAAPILDAYMDKKVFTVDPFVSIDVEGVGELVRIATERGREAKPDLKVGICGEHGGESKSVVFFEGLGLDYVSCSPYRVPVARLAAAQAAIRRKKGDIPAPKND